VSESFKLWCFRLLAVLFGLLLIALVEGALRVVGWGEEHPLADPFLQASTTLLFEPTTDDAYYQTRPEKLPIFPLERFRARKAPGEFRVFCLGGSTVQGRPYSRETAFPAWLQMNLQLAQPKRQWVFINCGGVSYGTHRLLPLLDECLNYEPDLIILATGHNEFLERRIYDHYQRLPKPTLKIARGLHQLHLYRALEQLFTPSRPPVPKTNHPPTDGSMPALPSDVDTLLDHRGGLNAYHYDPAWRQFVCASFEQNLRGMIRLAGQHDVPILVVRLPSNLKDCPPFKSEHSRPLSPEEQSHWDTLLTTANESFSRELRRTIELLNQALTIDAKHPLFHYLLGHAYYAQKDGARAARHFQLAKDYDVCPLRILSSMEEILGNVCREMDVTLVDAQALLANECAFGIIGNQVLLDHVHPSIRGHQQIAERLVTNILDLEGSSPAPGWYESRAAVYQAHIDALPPLYFTHGLRRLRAVRAWTEGRVDEPTR